MSLPAVDVGLDELEPPWAPAGDQLSLLGAEPVAFVYDRPRSAKVACTTCGRRGYPGNSWQDVCRRGHGECPRCGRAVSLRLDGLARVHTRCPEREAS